MICYGNAIPRAEADKCSMGHILEDGSFRFVSKAHPERNYITINRTAKQIFDLCDGSRSLDEIYTFLTSYYVVSNEHNLEEDLYDTVLRLWRVGVLSWDNGGNPFDKAFGKNKGGCYAHLMPETEVVEIITSAKNKDSFFIYFSAYASKEIELNIPFVKTSWFNQNRLYFELKGESYHLFLSLTCNDILKSYDIIFLALLEGTTPTIDQLCVGLTLVRELCNNQKLLGKDNQIFYFSSTTDTNPIFTAPIRKIGILKKENRDQDYCIFAFKS